MLAIDPTDYVALNNLAITYLNRRRYGAADRCSVAIATGRVARSARASVVGVELREGDTAAVDACSAHASAIPQRRGHSVLGNGVVCDSTPTSWTLGVSLTISERIRELNGKAWPLMPSSRGVGPRTAQRMGCHQR